MTDMKKQQDLMYNDPEDVGDVLLHIEQSLGFTFEENVIVLDTTFGELCDYIAIRVHADPAHDCTSQQAFYKTRAAIANVLQVSERTITPASSMEQLFPRPSRRKNIAMLKKTLGFPVKLLYSRSSVDNVLLLLLLGSLGGMFISWKMALVTLFAVITGLWLTGKFGKELKVDTVGALTLQLSREHYTKVRRRPGTMNKAEIEQVVKALFKDKLGYPDDELQRDRGIYCPTNYG